MSKEGIKRLGELLLEFSFINELQLKEGIELQKKTDMRIGEILVDLNYIKEDDLIQVLEFQLGIPHINLNNYIINPQIANYIPENIARRHNVIAITQKGKKLLVAMSDPTNLIAIDDIEMSSGFKIEPRIATEKAIKKALNNIYTFAGEDTTEIFASLNDYQKKDEPELDQLKEMVEDAPIVKLANLIIAQAIQMDASDIHIEPQEKDVRIRYRIDGVLSEQMNIPKYSQAALISRMKIIADLDITQRRIPQDGRVEMTAHGIKIDMRVSTLPTVFGEKIVIRLLLKDDNLIDIDRLGFSRGNYKYFKELIDHPHGILLVTGPTGSGKSTTLFAALNHLNTAEKNIMTIEDPVEYQISGVNQVQAMEKAGLTFARVLRAALRQDPDIVMVGEIRDEETAEIAIRAALTGHLVLSTLHTNDAVGSVTRLVDMGIPSYLVASTVIGVVAQRLVRRLCKSCREKYKPETTELKSLAIKEHDTRLYRAKGCKNCNYTGYKGRLAVHEILIIDEKVREMIVKGNTEHEIENYALSANMTSLRQDGNDKVEDGLTSFEELVRVIV